MTWSPDSKEFIIVYGATPMKTTLFDSRANPVFEFPQGPRNYVRYNPQGRLICIAGFGNLAGDMDVYDRRNFKLVSSTQASHSSVCEWSPDGRYILTAILTPRLRVDNGYHLWHYTGICVEKESFKELYQIHWKPSAELEVWKDNRALSPPPEGIVIEKKVVGKF